MKISTKSWHYRLYKFTYYFENKNSLGLIPIPINTYLYTRRILLHTPITAILLILALIMIVLVCGVVYNTITIIKFILGRKPKHGYLGEIVGCHGYINADLWGYEPYTLPTFIGVKWYPWKIIVGILAILALDFFFRYIHSDSFTNSIHNCVSYTGSNISLLLTLPAIILLIMSLVHIWKKLNVNQIICDFIRAKKNKYCQPIEIVDEDEEEKVKNGSVDQP